MKICFLAPANNYHTKKWCKWFTENGNEVHVVSFIDDEIENVNVHFVDTGASAESGDSQKIKYLLKAKEVKRIVNEIKPDIVNAHYATSYGTVAALSGLKGYVLSVWGSDVYDFPKKSFIHKAMLKFSLAKAKYIFSTSKAMAIETNKYTNKNIEITPFGVDMDLFNPNKKDVNKKIDADGRFVVGTVKALTPKYGIDYLIKAVSIIRSEYPEIPISLRIAGSGENEYKKLAIEQGIDDITTWLGFISQEDAAKEWANMDLAIIPSTLESESFGVSAVEAEACGTPVIISDIPGLMEATCPGQSSVVVERKNEKALAKAIVSLFYDEEKRKSMAIAGQEYVKRRFEVNSCFNTINSKIKDKINEYSGGGAVIDFAVFNPDKRHRCYKTVSEYDCIIGTVKGLEDVYGIDILLYAVAKIVSECPEIRLQVRIAGRGSKYNEYKRLSEKLKISEKVVWLGFISQEEAAREWANMDIGIIPSRQESFGVSAVEAQASGTAVIISDIPGLREATCSGVSSIVVEHENVSVLAQKILYLINNKEIRNKMAIEGRKFVADKYEVNKCFTHINELFDKYRTANI